MKQTKKKCLACGNNQTNHTLSWLSNTTTVLVHPFDKIIINNILGRSIERLIEFLTRPYLALLQSLRLISWNTDSSKALTERSLVIWQEAQKRKIDMKQLVILKKPVEFYCAILPNKKRLYFESIPQTARNSSESYTWMDDKSILKKKLLAKAIPVPKGGSVFSWNTAEKMWNHLEHPLIVKPRLGSRGRHTTTFIYTQEDLKKAFISAKKLSSFVVIEEHIIGSVYRGTCVNGKLLGVLEGMPPRITGTGQKTIATLITEKNASHSSIVKPVEVTPMLTAFLKRTGYTLESLLSEGETIDLSEKIGLSYGGWSRELYPETHPKIKEYIESAARVVNAGVVGFDFIIADPTADPDTQKWGIIECNSLPFINLHHHPAQGTPINVAGAIWDQILTNNTISN